MWYRWSDSNRHEIALTGFCSLAAHEMYAPAVHKLVGKEGLEPSIRKERDFESRAYTIPPLAQQLMYASLLAVYHSTTAARRNLRFSLVLLISKCFGPKLCSSSQNCIQSPAAPWIAILC